MKRLSGRCKLNVAWHALLFELPSCRPVQSRDASAAKYASSARRGKIPYGVQTLAETYPYAQVKQVMLPVNANCLQLQQQLLVLVESHELGMLAGAQSSLRSSARALVPELGWWALESETPGWNEQALQSCHLCVKLLLRNDSRGRPLRANDGWRTCRSVARSALARD